MKRRQNNADDNSETVRYPSFFRGAVAQHLRRERSAMAHYRIEIKRSGYWKAHFNLAWLMSQRRRLREAVRHYRLAIKHRPPRADATVAWMNLGLVSHQLDRPREASSALLRAWRGVPKDPAILLNLAMVFFENGESAKGKAWLRQWVRGGQHSAEDDKLAAYLLIEYEVDVTRGVALLKRWLRARPDDPVLRADLASAYAKLGDRRAASRFARQARELAARNDQDRQTRRIVLRALRKADLG